MRVDQELKRERAHAFTVDEEVFELRIERETRHGCPALQATWGPGWTQESANFLRHAARVAQGRASSATVPILPIVTNKSSRSRDAQGSLATLRTSADLDKLDHSESEDPMSPSNSIHLFSTRPFLFTVALATLAAGSRAQTLPGPVAPWPFDDGPTPPADVVNGHNGTITGAAFSLNAAPMPGCGQALQFYGADYVSVANAPDLSFAPGTPMTIALWLKETTDQSTVYYLGKRSSCAPSNIGINYQLARDAANGIYFASKDGGVAGTGVGVALDQWRHVAVTYDGTANLTIYIDGIAATIYTTYTLGGVNTANLLIGASGSCSGDIIGLIDEVWIFNRALTDAEVQLLASNNPGVYCTAKVNSLGCTPTMVPASSGPSISGPDDFYVTATNVLNNKTGILFWGTAPASVPFHGGIRCVAAPFIRTHAVNSGGNPPPNDCSGTYRFRFSHAYMASNLLTPGDTIYAQYWSRDPGFPSPDNIGLTDALEFVICP